MGALEAHDHTFNGRLIRIVVSFSLSTQCPNAGKN